VKVSDRNTTLMKAMGSKSGRYDPEPPDQNLINLHRGETARIRVQAWVKSKTTAYRHESPYCVDEHGKTLYVENMALELGWKIQTARNELNGAQIEGILRVAKDRKIWLCADIPHACKRRTKGDQSNSVQSWNSGYLADFIKKLPADRKKAAISKRDAYLAWRKVFFAEGQAVLRSIDERVENTMFQEIGVPKKRLPKRRPAAFKYVQLSLLAEPDFVQSCVADFVQTTPGTSYEPESNGVQGSPSLYASASASAPKDKSLPRSSSIEVLKAAGGRSKGSPEPPARPPDALKVGLTARKVWVDSDDLEKARTALGEVPLYHFFVILDDRLKRGKVGTPVLMRTIVKARETWMETTHDTAAVESRVQEWAEIELLQNIKNCEATMNDITESLEVREMASNLHAELTRRAKGAGG